MNVAGYHFHFITQDRSAGGHLLECQVESATVGIDLTSRLLMLLPESPSFYEADLSGSRGGEVEKVERESERPRPPR